MPLHDQYAKEILEELNYVATWLPTTRLVPGDVCTLRDYSIQVVSHLGEFDVDHEIVENPVETDFEYSSEGSVSISFKLSGESPPTGSLLTVDEAGISLRFSRSKAVLLRLADCSATRLQSLDRVGKQILQLHEREQWPDDYVVVTEAVTAGASTIIISKGADAGVDLAATGVVGGGALTLASLDAKLQIKWESNIGAKFVAHPGLTPLVRTSGIQKRFLRPDQFRSQEEPDEFAFDSVNYFHYAGDQ